MKKIFLGAFLVQSLFCYSQINQQELDKLPPEVREQILQALEKAQDQVKVEDIKISEEVKKAEKAKKPKAVKGKLPKETSLKPVDKEKVVKLVQQLGANHYKARKTAKLSLLKMDFSIVSVLKEQLSSTSDPEITESIKEIILKLTHRLHVNQLNDNQKAIAELSFKQGAVANPKVTGEFYNSNGHFIIDIGLTRLAFAGEVNEISNSYRRTVNISLEGRSGGGGSSSSNGFKIYDYTYEGGTGYWSICGKSFTVSNYELEIKKEKLNLKPSQPQILFFDKDQKAIGILDLK